MPRVAYERWPYAGAAALGPVTAAAVADPRLRPLAALLWHQTEEWVWPGGFQAWINREVIGSAADDHPLDDRAGFVINVAVGWTCSVAAAAGPRAAGPAALLYATHLGNVALHAGWALRHRRYDPGLVTALATLAPVALKGLDELRRDPAAPRRAVGAGLAAGVAMSVALPRLLKRRLPR